MRAKTSQGLSNPDWFWLVSFVLDKIRSAFSARMVCLGVRVYGINDVGGEKGFGVGRW